MPNFLTSQWDGFQPYSRHCEQPGPRGLSPGVQSRNLLTDAPFLGSLPLIVILGLSSHVNSWH